MRPLPNIFGFLNGRHKGNLIGLTVSEDGMLLAVCQSENLEGVMCDLGLDGISRKFHKTYDAHYPDGWRGEFIPSKDFNRCGKLQNAIAICESRKRQGKIYRVGSLDLLLNSIVKV